jgi:hypothetical protein
MDWTVTNHGKTIESRIVGLNNFSITPSNESLDSLKSGQALVILPILRKSYNLILNPPTPKEKIQLIGVNIFSADIENPNFYLENIFVYHSQNSYQPLLRLKDDPCIILLNSRKQNSVYHLNQIDYQGEEAYRNGSEHKKYLVEIKPFLQQLSKQDTDFHKAILNPGLNEKLAF